jgi:hypothetical protein
MKNTGNSMKIKLNTNLRRNLITSGLTLMVTAGMLMPASAALVAADVAFYDFNDQTGADSAGFADGTASAITVGSGFNFITNNSSFAYDDGGATDQYSLGGTPTAFGYIDVYTRYFANAYAANNYIEFSVTADQGSTIDLGVLDWVTSRGHSTRDLDDWRMVYSTNAAVDFADEASTAAQAVGSGNISGGLYVPLSVDLSSQDTLQLGETGTFRLYAYGRSATSTASDGTYFDSFQLQTVAVPEPSSAALLGLGGLALILRRRK